MPTMRRIREPEAVAARPALHGPCRPGHTPLFFDDPCAVMYRKIDTLPFFATTPTDQGRAEQEAGLTTGAPCRVAEMDRLLHAFSLIPSRMTHRPLLPTAGAPSERMNP
jgi:hypothetical protein